MDILRCTRTLTVASVAATAGLGGCAHSGVTKPSTPVAESTGRQVVERPRKETYEERELREWLAAPERFVRTTYLGERLFREVERLGREEGRSSLYTLFAVLLASSDDLNLQRAALFSLVRRTPAALEVAR